MRRTILGWMLFFALEYVIIFTGVFIFDRWRTAEAYAPRMNEDTLCGEQPCDLGVPETALDLRVKAAYWEGYSAGLEKCGPMLGLKK